MQDGPLDMRMGAGGRRRATSSTRSRSRDLADIIASSARRSAPAPSPRPSWRGGGRADHDAPASLPISSPRVLGRKRDETKHPATRTFQALRLYLNEELLELAHGLGAAERLLDAKGRLAVVTFHSLEDRIAKRFFASRSVPPPAAPPLCRSRPDEILAPSFRLLNRRPLEPGKDEMPGTPVPALRALGLAMRTAALRRMLSTLPRSGCQGIKVSCHNGVQFGE